MHTSKEFAEIWFMIAFVATGDLQARIDYRARRWNGER